MVQIFFLCERQKCFTKEEKLSLVRSLSNVGAFFKGVFFMGKNCVICGKPSGMYPLCKEHLAMKNDGKVVKCEECGTWHIVGEPCKCATKTAEVKPQADVMDDELTCIICGRPSNGKHFCFKCWNKYKDRSVDIRITNCKETEIIDEYGNKKIVCEDGRKVRSRAEKIINDFFFTNKIRVVYEKEIYYAENGENKTLHPDFYLPDYELYIEYNGLTSKSYLKSKEYTLKIYNDLNLKVEILTDSDIDNINARLKPLLGLH